MSEQAYNRKKTLPIVFISYFVICVLWGIYRLIIEKPLLSCFTPIPGEFVEGFIKILLMVLVPFILIYIVRNDLDMPIKRFMRPNLKTLWMGLGMSAAFMIFYSVRYIIAGKNLSFSLDIPATEIISSVFFAAITEEIMYRGFILNSLTKWLGHNGANLLTAVMFALMHLPIWIAGGTTDVLILLGNLFSTAFIGYFLGIVFIYSQSIWGAMLAHALHNLIVNAIRLS